MVAEGEGGSFGRVWGHRAGIVSEVGCRVVAEVADLTFATVAGPRARNVGGGVQGGN